MNTIVNVRQMGLQDRGVIRAVSARGELGRRIRDMGLVPGTEISVVGRAPLRDPVALRLRDYKTFGGVYALNGVNLESRSNIFAPERQAAPPGGAGMDPGGASERTGMRGSSSGLVTNVDNNLNVNGFK